MPGTSLPISARTMVETLSLDQLVHAVGDIALARRHNVGVRRKRALHIIEGREQRLRGLARFARDDADPMPLRSAHRAGRRRRRNARPPISMRATWLRISSGRSKCALVSRAPCGKVKDASPRGSPRPVTALTTPARGPSAPLKMRAASPLRSPAVWSERKRRVIALRPEHGDAASRRRRAWQGLSAKAPALAIVETVGEPHARCSPSCRQARVPSVAASALRSGA